MDDWEQLIWQVCGHAEFQEWTMAVARLSSVGSLTNPNKIASTPNSKQRLSGESTVSTKTIKGHIDYLEDVYLFEACRRYDVRGRDYFDYPNNYYCDDVGLKNAKLGFRQREMTHIMENILYNDFRVHGREVDLGVIYGNEKKNDEVAQVAREIDFIATRGSRKTYLRSAYALENEDQAMTESRPFSLTGDSFPKIIVRHDIRKRWYNEQSVLNIDILDFLPDPDIV